MDGWRFIHLSRNDHIFKIMAANPSSITGGACRELTPRCAPSLMVCLGVFLMLSAFSAFGQSAPNFGPPQVGSNFGHVVLSYVGPNGSGLIPSYPTSGGADANNELVGLSERYYGAVETGWVNDSTQSSDDLYLSVGRVKCWFTASPRLWLKPVLFAETFSPVLGGLPASAYSNEHTDQRGPLELVSVGSWSLFDSKFAPQPMTPVEIDPSSSADPRFGRRGDYYVYPLNVEIDGADSQPILGLDIATWEFAYAPVGNYSSSVKDGFIDSDPRRFCVRLHTGNGVSKDSVKVSIYSDHNANPIHNCPETQLEMEPDDDPNWLRSPWRILVSDVDDDAYAEHGAGPSHQYGDRTHIAEIEGTIHVVLTIQNVRSETTLHVVDADQLIERGVVCPVILKSQTTGQPVLDRGVVQDDCRKTFERFEQANVSISFLPPVDLDVSNIVDLKHGLRDTYDGGGRDMMAIVRAIPNFDASTRFVIYVESFYSNPDPRRRGPPEGEAVVSLHSAFVLAGGGAARADYVVAHEVGHILGLPDLRESSDLPHLMNTYGQTETAQDMLNKRLFNTRIGRYRGSEEIDLIRVSPLLK